MRPFQNFDREARLNPELDLYGVYSPALLWLMIAAYLLNALLTRLLLRTSFYRYIWHRALFNLFLFVIILGCLHVLAEGFPI